MASTRRPAVNGTLLTFTGYHDPYSHGLIERQEMEGPILSLISIKKFDEVFLISTPNTIDNTNNTEEAIQKEYPEIKISKIHLDLKDPTDYITIFVGLRKKILPILALPKKSKLFVSTASGTPQMHSCWLLLIAGGELPATILHIQPKKFTGSGFPEVKEINLANKAFPSVRAPFPDLTIENDSPNINDLIKANNIVGDHPAFLSALEKCALLAEADCPILILGQSGTGKEVFARISHQLSKRRKGPFIAINCASIPEKLAESILFGHVKGAFTGAGKTQIGKIAQANGGTVFLDELGAMSVENQSKLLRVLQDKIVEPLGSQQGKKVDIRIMAATNTDLKEAILKGFFREDLYFRLNIGEIYIPPLTERMSDIPKLALSFLDNANRFVKRPKKITSTAIDKLMKYHWPGNVRELSNVIERAVIICRGDEITDEHVEFFSKPEHHNVLPVLNEGFEIEIYVRNLRKKLFCYALEQSNGNQSKASKLLGVSPQAVHQFIKDNKL